MTYRRQVYDKYTRMKDAEKQRRVFGRCSIYKILDDDRLDTQEKIAYIRHNYVYYDGNESMFNDPDTKRHNQTHTVLNDIIRLVVYKKTDPGLLRETNMCIMNSAC